MINLSVSHEDTYPSSSLATPVALKNINPLTESDALFTYFGIAAICFLLLLVIVDFLDSPSESAAPVTKETLSDAIIRLDRAIEKLGRGPASFIMNQIWTNAELVFEKDPEDTQLAHDRVRAILNQVVESLEDYISLTNGRSFSHLKVRAGILRSFYYYNECVKKEVSRIDEHRIIMIESRAEASQSHDPKRFSVK